MPTIETKITITCATSAQHLQVSNLLKTVLGGLDYAIEGKHPGNDMVYSILGDHPDSKAQLPDAATVAKTFGEKL